MDYLERTASPTDKEQGLDLADFLLRQPNIISHEFTVEAIAESASQKPFNEFPSAPLIWDAAYQLERIRWCVLPIDAHEECLINQ